MNSEHGTLLPRLEALTLILSRPERARALNTNHIG